MRFWHLLTRFIQTVKYFFLLFFKIHSVDNILKFFVDELSSQLHGGRHFSCLLRKGCWQKSKFPSIRLLLCILRRSFLRTSLSGRENHPGQMCFVHQRLTLHGCYGVFCICCCKWDVKGLFVQDLSLTPPPPFPIIPHGNGVLLFDTQLSLFL